ncbi:MAG: hypothetical protein HYY16_14810 [Planctomycetes bacterium]|nr:hypothetical protein [Planctomycetota bacterium]
MRYLGRALLLLVVLNGSCLKKSCTEAGPRIVLGSKQSRLLSPFPTDRLTVPDPSTATGLRVDLPMPENGNELERQLVEEANRLDGFGVFAPLCIQFDQPLDLTTVRQDSCFLVNVQDGSRVPLDLDLGYYPIDVSRPLTFFPNDPTYPSLILSEKNRVAHYEDVSDTLILRPTVPLKPASRYVAILSRRIHGTDGLPVQPPANESPTPEEFNDFVQAIRWTDLTPADVGFYWTFTTQSVSRELELIRAGLDGQGSMSWLAEQFPPRVASITDLGRGLFDGNPYTLEGSICGTVFSLIYRIFKIISPLYPKLEMDMRPYGAVFGDTSNVDYFFFGKFQSPNFLATPGGTFSIDGPSGTATFSSASVPFMVSVPKPTAENNYAQPPYPVVVVGHGLTGSRIMTIPFANQFAARGLAVACIDFVGHGPQEQIYMFPRILKGLHEPWASLVKPLILAMGAAVGCTPNPLNSLSDMVDKVFSCGFLAPICTEGRSPDLDGDGILEPTRTFFSANFFQMRDNMRQCVVDLMQFIRILRRLGQDVDLNGTLDVAEGDIDRDGVLDLGGPNQPITYSGISLGSIIGGVLMGVDPLVSTGALNVAGGGLADIMFRTTILREPYVRHVILDIFGLAIVGRPADGQIRLTFNDAPIEDAFWSVPADMASHMEIQNVTKGRVETPAIGPDGSFIATMLCDAGDDLLIRVTSPFDQVTEQTVKAPVQGLGLPRATRRAREYFMLTQWFLEPADPICYAPYWWQRPLAGMPEKQVLLQLTPGDPTVCISSGVALARAAGLICPDRMQLLVDMKIPIGENLAVDQRLPVESAEYRAVRFHAAGRHSYLMGDNRTMLDKSKEFALAAQDQLAVFCQTGGIIIPEYPIFEEVIPDGN